MATIAARRGMTIVAVVGILALGFALVRPAGGLAPTTSASTSTEPKDSGGGGSGGGGFSFGGGGEGKRVEVSAPRRGSIASSIEAPGTVQAGSEAGCGAPFEGQVAALVRDTGDRVKAGEVLFRLDPDAHQERVVEADIDLDRKRSARDEALVEVETAERKHKDAEKEPSDVTEARLKVRQSELESQRASAQLESAANKRDRSRQMLAQGIATSIDLEAAESEHRVTEISVRLADEQLGLSRETLTFRERTWLESQATAGKDLTVARSRRVRADADLRGAEVALARARRDLERTEIRSPISGVVTGRGVNMGDQVSRATGDTSHYIVSDLEHMLVYLDVDEGDISRLAEGQSAAVRVGALGEELRLTGKVYDVGMRAAKKTGDEVPTFTVRVLIDTEQPRVTDLRPGMTATVVIETARLDDALKVPLQAVLQRELRALPDAVKTRAPAALTAGKRPFDLVDLVFTVEDGKAHAHIVKRGLQDEDEVALEVGGPADTAQVIVGPFRSLEKLEEGDAVRGEPAEVALPEEDGVAPVGSKT